MNGISWCLRCSMGNQQQEDKEEEVEEGGVLYGTIPYHMILHCPHKDSSPIRPRECVLN